MPSAWVRVRRLVLQACMEGDGWMLADGTRTVCVCLCVCERVCVYRKVKCGPEILDFQV